MSPRQRILSFAGAVACITTALMVLAPAGLPHQAAFTGQVVDGQTMIAPELNALAPDFERLTLSGDPVRLSDLRGTPVVLNFWATWCSPCIVEMPILQSVFEARRETGLRILAVNLGEPASVIRAWQQANHLTFDLLVDERQQVAALYRLRGQPSTYLITPDGRISSIFFGPVSESTLTAALENIGR